MRTFKETLDDLQALHKFLLDGQYIDLDLALEQLPLTDDQLDEARDEGGELLSDAEAAAQWLFMNEGPWWVEDSKEQW